MESALQSGSRAFLCVPPSCSTATQSRAHVRTHDTQHLVLLLCALRPEVAPSDAMRHVSRLLEHVTSLLWARTRALCQGAPAEEPVRLADSVNLSLELGALLFSPPAARHADWDCSCCCGAPAGSCRLECGRMLFTRSCFSRLQNVFRRAHCVHFFFLTPPPPPPLALNVQCAMSRICRACVSCWWIARWRRACAKRTPPCTQSTHWQTTCSMKSPQVSKKLRVVIRALIMRVSRASQVCFSRACAGSSAALC